MKKTINMNLAGMIFNIDEDAFDILEKYLSDIRNYLMNETDSDEIMLDIEARIAELFHQWKSKDAIITINEVEKAKERLGKPETYLDQETENNYSSENESTTDDSTKKRLFRDAKNGIIGGVYMGIAQYFDINILWLRLFAIIFLIGVGPFDFGSTLIISYIILWVILPKATTRMDYFKMYGKPINIDTIKENFNDINTNFSKLNKNDFRVNKIEDVLRMLLKIAFYILKIIISIFIIMLVISLIILFFTIISYLLFDYNSFRLINEKIFDHNWEWVLAFMSLLLFIIALSIGCIRLIIRMLKNDHTKNFKRIGYFNFGVLIFSVIMIGFIAILFLNRNNKYFEVSSDKIEVSASDSLVVVSDFDATNFSNNFSKFNRKSFFKFNNEAYKVNKNGELLIFDNPKIEIKKSENNTVYFVNTFESRGDTEEEAYKNSHNIGLIQKIDSNNIKLADYIKLPKEAKFRMQNIRYTLYLPVGYKAKINKRYSMYSLGEFVDFDFHRNDNSFNTYKMTEEGIISIDSKENELYENIIINDEGIRIEKKRKSKKEIYDTIKVNDSTFKIVPVN